MDLTTAHRALRDISKKLDDLGVKYWVDGGTALGLYRDGHLLEHDHDLDFAINYYDLFKIDLKVFSNYKTYTGKINDRTISIDLFKDDLGINLFIAYDLGENLETIGIMKGTHKIIYRTPKKYFQELGRIWHNGKAYPSPANLDEYFSKKYGEWRVTNKKWSTVFDGFMYKIEKLKSNEEVTIL